MQHGIRVLTLPEDTTSLIDFLFKKINSKELDSYDWITIDQKVYNQMKTCPLLTEENDVWKRKGKELSYKVFHKNDFDRNWSITWIQIGTKRFEFSPFPNNQRGISISSSSKH